MLRNPRNRGLVLAFLCACSGGTLKLGESDKDLDSGSNDGGSANAPGSGGTAAGTTGGGGTLGSGAMSGGGSLGSGGALGSGATGGDGSLGSGGTVWDGGIAGNDGSPDGEPSCPDAGAPSPWWHERNSHDCESEGRPSREDLPTCASDGTSLAPIYLAMSRLRLGAANDDAELSPNLNAWLDIGFDLDGSCTRSATCKGNNGAPVDESACRYNPDMEPIDGNRCRDNVFGALFGLMAESPLTAGWLGLTEADWNCELHR